MSVYPDRVDYRNGYRQRRWDTRAGTIELAIPNLRAGSYFPEWLLDGSGAGARARRSGPVEPGGPLLLDGVDLDLEAGDGSR